MADLLKITDNVWFLPTAGIILLLAIFLLYRLLRGRAGGLERAMAAISFDRVDALVIPSADEGEILVDHLLLTTKGLLVLEVKHVEGTVFGGDKLQDWTVIARDGRFTFSNPQPALYDRIAAVR